MGSSNYIKPIKNQLQNDHGRSKTTTTIHTETKQDIPQSEIDALARLLLSAIREFYENEENQKQFEV